MNQYSKIEVVNREGWRKEYPLQKSIVHIGSASTNDIILEEMHGTGVAALHAQLIASASDNSAYKLVNLANMDIVLGSSGEKTLAPRSTLDMVDGETLKLGEFTLIFRSNGGGYGGSTVGGGGRYIGLRLSMPKTRLAPNQSLDGVIIIRNLGERTGVRFDLELEGLDADCYDIEPGPLLSSGAEKEVFFRLHHRGAKPLAGDWRITIRATAPRAYPGEQASASQVIQVLPLYHHRLRLMPSEGVSSPSQAEQTLPAAKAKNGPLPPVETAPAVSPSRKAEDVWVIPTAAGPSQPDSPPALKLKAGRAAARTKVEPAAQVEAGPPSQAEDLWSAPVETGPPPPPKVSPPPEAEDLWSAPVEPGPAPQVEAAPEPQVETAPPLQAEEGQAASTETGLSPPAEVAPVLMSPPEPQAETAPQLQPRVEEQPVSKAEIASPVPVKTAKTPEIETDIPPPVEQETLAATASQTEAQPTPKAEVAAPSGVKEQSPPETEVHTPPPIKEERLPPAKVETGRPAEQELPVKTEPDLQPQKKGWWTQLTELLPFGRSRSQVLPPAAADEQPAAEAEQAAEAQVEAEIPSQAGPAPQMQAAQMPQIETDDNTPPPVEGPAEEEPEPVQTEVVQVEADVLPQAEAEQTWPVEVAEEEIPPIEAEMPVQATGVEVDTLSEVEAEQAAEAQVETPLQVEEKSVPAVETDVVEPEMDIPVQVEEQVEEKPAPEADAEDWWAAEPEADTPMEAKEQVEEKPASEIETDVEDWWAAEPETDTPVEATEQVEEKAVLETETDVEDWWVVEPETDVTVEVEKRQVLKLKASPPPPKVERKQTSEVEELWTAEADA